MVFPARLAVLHLLDVVFVRGLAACPRFPRPIMERGRAVRPRTKTTSRRCSTARRAGKTIEMRVQSCLERPEAIPEAEAAPFQVPDSRGLTGERGQAVRPRTKTTSRRCSTARRAGKTIEMRVQSCLERPEAIPEAEAAPHEVPRLHAETARASTPEDIISASGIAPGR